MVFINKSNKYSYSSLGNLNLSVQIQIYIDTYQSVYYKIHNIIILIKIFINNMGNMDMEVHSKDKAIKIKQLK